VKVVKNKLAPPFREAEFDILYGQGISRSGEVVDMGADEGIVTKSGAWYSLEGERIGQGRDNARRYLEEHAKVLAHIEKSLLERHGIVRPRSASDPEPASSATTKAGRAEGSSNGTSRRASRPS
jgi:recombination protein RecA